MIEESYEKEQGNRDYHLFTAAQYRSLLPTTALVASCLIILNIIDPIKEVV